MAQSKHRVNVYEDRQVIARVKYNNDLDYWNGSNWTNGGTGLHLGITRLKDGRYVLIHGSQWVGSHDYGEIVSDHEALQEILRSGSEGLLEKKKFAPLKKLYQEAMIEEEDDEEDEN